MAVLRPGAGILSIALTLGYSGQSLTAAPLFVRGDTDGNGAVQITDAVQTLRFLFRGGAGNLECFDAADADDDGAVVLSDAVFVLNFLFRSGDPVSFPFPHCSIDPTEDALDCDGSPACTPAHPIYDQDVAGNGFFFCIDRSPPMSHIQSHGGLNSTKREVNTFLEEIAPGSEFGIVFFDGGVISFPASGQAAKATEESIAAATAWVDSVPGGSGTCFGPGLQATLDLVDSSTASRKTVIYVGDGGGACRGQSENEHLQQSVDAVSERNNGRAQINTFGVLMSGRNPRFEEVLIELAERNGGLYTRVGR